MRIFFKTFGCRVNQYETESLRARLLSGGVHSESPDYESAEVCILNTCTVTGEADKDALLLLRRISRRNPSARIVVTGCLATRAAEQVLQAAPAAQVVGNARKEELPALLGLSAQGCPAGSAGIERNRSRAVIKVQDGCDMKCSYCIVPSVRPVLSSRAFPEVAAEVRALLAQGIQEIVLCGVRLGRCEMEGGKGLLGLLSGLCALEGDFRIRLSSLEISDIGDAFLDGYAALGERVCPSFHLPLQSGSDSVLSRMNRCYRTAHFRARMQALRERLPGVAVFTDILCGFPGETDEEAAQTQAFIRELRFAGLHVFRFSARPGTPAADLPGRLNPPLLRERAESLRALDGELRAAFAAEAVGSFRRVLVEERSPAATATTDHFLRVELDRDPGPGLHFVRIASSSGPLARAVVQQSNWSAE
ncbi:MAG: MiaB/RimO family radical SAM methylthiotransferase [Elusimicrobiota bacterium]|jgi:threonylcarbamoyladenosine tRNA methylthiotransferase MtaB